MLGVARRDAADQVLRTAHGVHLEHLGRVLERAHGLGEAALCELQHHERLDRVAQLRRVDLGTVARHHPALLQLGEPRLHRAARHAEAARDLQQAQARVLAQLGDQPGVEVIDGQSDQNLARLPVRSGQIVCSRCS
jgi:hypothetical protein